MDTHIDKSMQTAFKSDEWTAVKTAIMIRIQPDDSSPNELITPPSHSNCADTIL